MSDGQDTMRLASSGRPPVSGDVAAALTVAVGMLGQRPAITGHVLGDADADLRGGASGRREQGFASLAGWVAKGANLLHTELGLGAGDRLALAGPPGWPLAAVTLSAWWLGLTVVPAPRTEHTADGAHDAHGVSVVVTHVDAPATQDAPGPGAADPSVPHLIIGDALDGTAGDAVLPGDAAARGAESWTDAVTPHGDRPPPATHDGDLVALVTTDGAAHTQRTLLALLTDDPGGVVGLLRGPHEDLISGPDAARRLATLVLRPLVTGAATVVVDVRDPDRETHGRSERVTRWLERP